MTNSTMLTVSCPNCSYWKMQIRVFIFLLLLIHSYTHVVPISRFPKYSGGLSLRKKKCLESFKSTPLIVSSTCLHLPICAPCLSRGWSLISGNSKSKFTKSLCICATWSTFIVCICCFVLWSIKIWEVYSSRRPIDSGERSVCLLAAAWSGPRSNGVR